MQYLPIKYISVCSMMIRDIYKNLKYFCVTFAKIHPGNPPLIVYRDCIVCFPILPYLREIQFSLSVSI